MVFCRKRCEKVGEAGILVGEVNKKNILFLWYRKKIVSLQKKFKNKKFKNRKDMMLSDRLKELRKQCDLPQRKVAAELDIDTATYCKIENGNYSPKREQVVLLASIFHSKEKELLTLWLADQIKEITETNKDIAKDAMKIVKLK